MFDVSMIELALIALVALLVLGPERLPRAARTAGFYLRKARASWHSIRSDIERELAADDLKRAMKETEQNLLAPPNPSPKASGTTSADPETADTPAVPAKHD